MLVPLATGRLDLEGGTLDASGGVVCRLTEQERELLAYLASRPHEDVSREELQREVLGYADSVVSRAVDHAIKRIRAKVEPVPARPIHVVSVRGTGYRFVPLAEVAAAPLALGDRVVDLDRLEVRQAGTETVSLSATEGRILELLLATDGRPVSQEELLRTVWGIYDRSRKRVVDKAIYRLRAKIEATPGDPAHLRTIRGKGLVLDGLLPVVESPDEVDVPWVCRPPERPVLGRIEDEARVRAALDADGAWVTLVGAGGVGKSSLAREVGSAWPDAASWTDLTGAGDAAAVWEALAAAHGVDVPSENEAGPLAAALSHAGDVLMVIDNAEGAVDALPSVLRQLTAELERRPRILVTSRTPLRFPEERVVALAPLPRDAARDVFVSRAAQAGAPVDADDPVLDEILERIGGTPLAIELAAARLPLLGLTGVYERLDQPLRLLRTQAPTDPRHASMEHVWALTWRDLPEPARIALSASAAFVGSFRLDALEHVLSGSSPHDPLDSIQELTDRMLLERLPGGRLRLPVAVAEFVAEQAADPDRASFIKMRALEWVAELGGEVVAGMEPPPDAYAELLPELEGALALAREGLARRWFDAVGRCLWWALALLGRQGMRQRATSWAEALPPLDDLPIELHDALAWRIAEAMVLAGRRPEAAAVVADRPHASPEDPLTVGYALRAAVGFPEALVRRARAQLESANGPMAVLLCRGLAHVHEEAGRIEDTSALHRRAIRFAETADLPWHVSDARRWLGATLRGLGRGAEALPHIDQAVQVRDRAGLPAVPSYYGARASLLSLEGRHAEVLAVLREGVDVARHRGDLVTTAWLELKLAIAHGRQGELVRAAEWFRAGRATHLRLGALAGAALATANLGETLRQLGHNEEARRAYEDALRLSEGLGNPRVPGIVWLSRARMELEAGHVEAAKTAIEQGYREMGITDLSLQRVAMEVVYAEVLARLGDAGALERARVASERARASFHNDVLVQTLCHHGNAALALAHPEEAAALLEEAAALVDELGLLPSSSGRKMVERLADALDEAR